MDIASMLEVEVQEVVESKENVIPSHASKFNFSCQTFSDEENNFYKLTYGNDVASIRFLRLHCTACDEHIGSAPAEVHNMHEHPVLRTLLCSKCHEFYGDGTFEQGDDATDMFCRWCANGGNLYCCSYCSNTFCSKCIKRNFDSSTIKKIEAEDSWKCFVCDTKDLFPLRSIARALITHIETVTRILENDRQMSLKEIKEKMHLDESKCCSRKRKHRRRQIFSDSDDEEEDSNYTPDAEMNDSPPVKKQQIRKESVCNTHNNGYTDHEYFSNSKTLKKIETDLDPTDLMIPCEQTMIEGDTEIINPNDSYNSLMIPMQQVKQLQKPRQHECQQLQQPQQHEKQQLQYQKKQLCLQLNQSHHQNLQLQYQKEQKQKTELQNLKIQKRVQQQSQLLYQHRPHILQKIVSNNSVALNPVPLKNLVKVSLSTGAKSFKVTHAVNKKLVAVPLTVVPNSAATSSTTYIKNAHLLLPKNLYHASPQQQKKLTIQTPSVIDLDSDDEPTILENNNKLNNNISTMCKNTNIVDNIETAEKKILEEVQSQEIDNTLAELKTKILKLVQVSNTKTHENQDLLYSAAVCTKRFHRALRKTLVELSHINDRVVRDYVHWKKKSDKMMTNIFQEKKFKEIKDMQEMELVKKVTSRIQSTIKDDLTLEMICVRDSASESDNEENKVDNRKSNAIEPVAMPAEFSQILDHLTIFKRKATAVKAIGDNSVLMKDKACQAYDLPWKDYEKYIRHSLLTKLDSNSNTQKNALQPSNLYHQHFGKYQEQFLSYLQHIEDFGIETDELKGLPDPNHISLKDLTDDTSPYTVDVLERFSPMTLPNGYAAPPILLKNSSISNKSNIASITSSSSLLPLIKMNTGSSTVKNNISNLQYREPHETTAVIMTNVREINTKVSDENMTATSKVVEELVKMVTKLSGDVVGINTSNSQQKIDEEIVVTCTSTSNNNECTILK